MRMKKAILALTITTLAAISACSAPWGDFETDDLPSSAKEDKTSDISPDGLVKRDISRWALPTDPYNSYPSEIEQYASELALAECMLEGGHYYTVIKPDLDPPPHPGFNDAGRRLFNSDIAAKYGYHFAPDPDGYRQALRERDLQDLEQGDEWQKAFLSCAETLQTSPAFPRQSDSVSTAALSGANDPKVLDAARTWRDCMKPLGIVDLPESPEEMPSSSLAARFHLSEIDPLNGPDAVPGAVSEEEIRIATFDAQCQESSGYLQAYYDAEWANDYEFVAENLNELRAAQQEELEQIEQLRAYIAAHPLAS